MRISSPSSILSGFGLTLLLGACAIWPGHDSKPTCRPAVEHELYPKTEKEAGFPSFEADIWRSPTTLDFQVCDSAVGDLNNDGRAELLVADHIEPGFGYFLNDPPWFGFGGRIFEDGTHVPLKGRNNNSAGVVVADFNGDGMLDVANSNHPGTVSVSLNRSEEGDDELQFPAESELTIELGIKKGPEYGLAGREGGLVAADFNGDGLPDIATADLGLTKHENVGYSKQCPQGSPDAERYGTTVLMNTTEPGATVASFAEGVHFPLVGPAISIASADFNFDGKMDLVTADTAKSSLSVLTNYTEQTKDAVPCFTAPQRLHIPKEGLERQGAGPTNPVAVDLNADGKPDLASANWNVRTITFWINLTDEADAGKAPSFSEATVLSTGKLPPLVLNAADLDDDGLTDMIVIPLSTHSKAAVMVLRNETEPGGDKAVFEVDAVYNIPRRLRNGWLYTYFSSAGAVHDFDGDGMKDIGVVIAKGSLLLKAMKSGNDILAYVDPGVPLWVVHPVLPDKSFLVVYRRTDSVHSHSELPLCEQPARLTPLTELVPVAGPPTGEDEVDFCELSRRVLESVQYQTVYLSTELSGSELTSRDIRSGQAELSADLLEQLVAAAPPEQRDDLRLIAEHIDLAGERVELEPSWHIDHDIGDAVYRVTDFLREECGD